MGLKKWLMKQQWRIVQIRAIWSLFYGILILSIAYVKYIPFLVEMGNMAPFVFAGIILFVFLILGYIYDRVLVMWAPSQEVSFERNPFQYVPSPKEKVFWFPVYSAMLEGLEELARNSDLDSTTIQETRDYYSQIQHLRPERNEDIDRGIELRKEFVKNHRFLDILDRDSEE